MRKIITLALLTMWLGFIPDAFAFKFFQHSGEYHDDFESYYELCEEVTYDPEEDYLHWNFPQNLPFNVNANSCYGLDSSNVIDSVKAGFQEWTDVGTSIYFSYYGTTHGSINATDNMTTVYWGDWEGWDSNAITLITYNTSTLLISDVDIFMNDDKTWYINEDYFRDVQNVITHEVGHLLGIAHSDYSDPDKYYTRLFYPETYHGEYPTMLPAGIWNNTHNPLDQYFYEIRSLAQDDIDAIECLEDHYGGSKKPSIPQPESIAENSVSVFPNPANPISNITYSIAAPSHVTLDIFSITGQKVATLVDDYRDAGEHTAVFDGAHLSSGLYLYRFRSESFSTTGRLMILK